MQKQDCFEIGDFVTNLHFPGDFEIIGIVDEDIWLTDKTQGSHLVASRGEYKLRLRNSIAKGCVYAPKSVLKKSC